MARNTSVPNWHGPRKSSPRYSFSSGTEIFTIRKPANIRLTGFSLTLKVASALSTPSLSGPFIPPLGVATSSEVDLVRYLPGGIPAVRQMVDKFHNRGVKVFFPILAWDTGTRNE